MNRHKHPEVYMKKPYNKTYFEGWYYKQVDGDCSHAISFIPSVSFSKNRSRAYIQVMYRRGDELITDICEYDISGFKTVEDPFSVKLANSYFSKKKISINFKGSKLSVKGTIYFSDFTELSSTFMNPNIMGYFSYIPFKQCNHGVLSMNHSLIGSLNINGEDISFKGGSGYIEKDWGTSFPKEYMWIQCNHFKREGVSLFLAIAQLPAPALGIYVEGFVCNLLIGSKQYRFATYTGAKLRRKVENDLLKITIKEKKYTLSVVANSENSKELLAPRNGEMTIKIRETLSGYIKVELKENASGRAVYVDESLYGAIEIVK